MRYLTVEEVIFIHDRAIEKNGGFSGIRDMGLLLSAIEIPKAEMFGHCLHPDILDKAAAYLFHIISNHPFIDANKRTGFMACVLFLDLNGVSLEFDEKSICDFVVEIANGKHNKKQISEFLKVCIENRSENDVALRETFQRA